MKHANPDSQGRPLILGLDGTPNEFDVPQDPSSTAYPLFWETYDEVAGKVEFYEVFPDKPDRFMPVAQAATGRVSLSPLGALTRNRTHRDAPETATINRIIRSGPLPLTGDDEPPAPGPGTHPAPSSSPEGTERSS